MSEEKMSEEKMSEEKVTEEKVTEEKETEDETIPEFVKEFVKDWKDGRDAKLYKLHALMNECVRLARETVEGKFAEYATMEVSVLGEMTSTLAVALFHKVSVPDQTETMLAALERGLEWYGRWQEEQKAESEKISADFQKSISAVLPKPPRLATALEVLVRNLIDFASRFSEVELTKLSDAVEEARETEIGRSCPTS